MSRIPGYLIACFLFLSLCSSVNASSNIVSRPVGFIKVSIAKNEQRLVSLPFRPFDASINKVLAGQLTGSTKEKSSDQVLKLDASVTKYVQALKADGTGNREIDGKWFSDLKKLIPSDMMLEPGEGFFIWNRQAMTQDVFLAGEVVLDATNSMVLMPSFNLVGYPYSTSVKAEDTQLKNLDGSLTNSEFLIGKGYWFNNTTTGTCIWAEVRPYADVFPAEGGKPVITDIQIGNGTEAVLTIECEGVAGEKLDIYYKDIMPENSFDPEKGWLIADVDIPVQGRKTIEWTDTGNSQRKPVNEVFVRYYLAGRANIDMNQDGVPDAREKFVFGKSLSIDSGTGASVLQTDPLVSSGTSSNLSSTTNSVSQFLPLSVSRCRVIYVDRHTGDDQFSGRSVVTVGNDGPKKTIKSGLQEAGSEGNTMIVKSGAYSENLNIAGRNLKVFIQGNVDLRGNARPIPSNKIPAVIPPFAQNNFMNSVTNR